MKLICFIYLTAIATSVGGCVQYKSGFDRSRFPAGAAAPASDNVESGGGEPAAEGEETPEEAPPADAENGKTLLTACAACHKSGGTASTVTLNAEAISRLDDALAGTKSDHSAFQSSFEEPARADLEAALNLIK